MNGMDALGWALVHFVWQGAALAVVLGVLLSLTRVTASRARYGMALATLAAMLIVPAVTAFHLYSPPGGASSLPGFGERQAVADHTPSPSATPSPSSRLEPEYTSAPAGAASAPIVSSRFASLRARLVPALPWLVVLWAVGVVVLSIRLARGWTTARRLRTDGTHPSSPALLAMLERLAARLRVSRPVQLLESVIVEVPAVIGWLRPVILVPASALTGLTPQQIEVLLAHELAHVRRHDFLVNLVQSVIETLLFYHPAVWWVSRRVREEREHCCDDLVVRVCGDADLYASALVGMERLRGVPPSARLALAATGSGGSLVHRVRRLIVPATARGEFFPRWAAGVAAVTIALLATGGAQVAGTPPAAEAMDVFAADTSRTAPDTVLRHPDQTQSLATRWEWARTEARRLNRRIYWVGYRITRPQWLDRSVYIDRETDVTGQDITIRGTLFGDFQGFVFRGVRLAPLVGGGDSDDIALLFGFSTDANGRPILTRVHVASFYLPTDFAGRTLFWLGDADDAQSVPLVEALYAATPRAELREDVVAAVGIHGASAMVVPILLRWLNGRDPEDVRSQAAEWLGFHPTPAAVAALSRAARADAAGDVRREAAEALGDNTLPAATDSAIAVARTASDPEARREAVEGLGEKETERALAALIAIAQSDRDEDVQREAVETLGDVPGGRGLPAVRDVARTHARADVRREAIETLGEHLPAAEAIPVLKAIASGDPNPDVQREAVETLGDLHEAGGEALAVLTEIARSHPSTDVRREAVETIGELAPTAETVRLLAAIALNDRSEDVQREAVETLGEIGELGLPAVIEIARTHPSPEARREAIETVGEHAPASQALDLLAQIARRDRDPDVQREAIETLGELHDARAYTLLVEFARTHPVSDVRRQAIETLGETGRTDSVIDILDGVARAAGDPDVSREAVETLGELHDARALSRVAGIARTHPNTDVRREAIETYAENATADSAVALLTAILNGDAPDDVYGEVLESLEELEGGAGIPALIEAARSHPIREVRSEALRRLAESDDPRAQQLFERTLRRP
jgi:HEAT repeat protein/beta-lactamase regulating signal transducer with metallopeptidase domain